MTTESRRRDRLLSLVTRLYQAPEHAGGWRAFLEDLCTTLDGSAASFIAHDPRSMRYQLSESVQIDPDVRHAYNSHWHAEDPWPASRGLSAGVPS